MLSTDQIDYFRTFGFLALPGLLGAERSEVLRAEVDAAIKDAYATTYDERVIDGISGHYLPMASSFTPCSASLICDDPVLLEVAEQLLGAPLLPSVPEGVLYFAEAGWHNDDGIGVTGVKLVTYFDSLDATNGALRFIPCSHQPGVAASLRAYQSPRQREYPGVAVGTRPGDVIAFDLHTFHASSGGTDRLAWAIEYLAAPESEEARSRTLRWMTDAFEQGIRGFDRERYPVWRDWGENGQGNARRHELIERMRAVGVLDLPGAAIGW